MFKKLKQQSHSVYNPNAHRAYEKSQHAEDFGRIKINIPLTRFSSYTLARD